MSFYDEGNVSELEGHFLDDLGASEGFDLERWKNRPLRKRVGEYAGELFRQSF